MRDDDDRDAVIAGFDGPRFPRNTLDGTGDRVDYYRFTLSEAKRVGLGLRRQDADADLFLEDAGGNVLHSSTVDGTANEWISQTLLAGTYYIRVEAQEEGNNDFKLRYGVSAPDADEVARLEQQEQGGTNERPTFGLQNYTFSLAENADGSTDRVALGTVTASDPEAAALTYSIEGGNEAGLFELDASTGELYYVGGGEDYESGSTSHALRVEASDGTHSVEVAVTVTLTDVVEVSVADAQAHEGDGVLRFQVTLDGASTGAVTVRYETVDGQAAVAGKDYEAASGELTFAPGETEKWVQVRIHNDLVDDTGETFTLGLLDASGASVADAEAQGSILNNEVTIRTIDVDQTLKGRIDNAGEIDWFEVELVAGQTYQIDMPIRDESWGDAPNLLDPCIYGIYDERGILFPGTTNDNYWGGGYYGNWDARVFFTPEESGTYYIKTGAAEYQRWLNGIPAHTGKYSLSVAGEPPADTDDTTGTVAVDGSTMGDIESPRDLDWFAVEFEAGRAYRIDLEGTDTGSGTLGDPYLRGIRDEHGNLIAGTTNDDGGYNRNSRVHFEAETAGTYYIAAGAYGSHAGTYELSVDEL